MPNTNETKTKKRSIIRIIATIIALVLLVLCGYPLYLYYLTTHSESNHYDITLSYQYQAPASEPTLLSIAPAKFEILQKMEISQFIPVPSEELIHLPGMQRMANKVLDLDTRIKAFKEESRKTISLPLHSDFHNCIATHFSDFSKANGNYSVFMEKSADGKVSLYGLSTSENNPADEATRTAFYQCIGDQIQAHHYQIESNPDRYEIIKAVMWVHDL